LLCPRYVVPNGFFANPIEMIATIAIVSKVAGSILVELWRSERSAWNAIVQGLPAVFDRTTPETSEPKGVSAAELSSIWMHIGRLPITVLAVSLKTDSTFKCIA
jgi:hypothetical protein